MHPRFEKSMTTEQHDDGWTSFHWFGLVLMGCFVMVGTIIYTTMMSFIGRIAP